jgi:hypothetical protein
MLLTRSNRSSPHFTFRSTALIALAAMGMAGSATAQTPAGPHDPAKGLQPVSRLPAPDVSPAPVPFCFGDGSQAACPCENTGAAGRGCENSAFTGGAILWATGHSRILSDTVQLHVQGELPSALSIVLQGDAAIRPAPFGDGLRCTGGALTRLYVQTAVNGTLSVPQAGERSISMRSVTLGDPIGHGEVRYYQVYYRDSIDKFCRAPLGGAFNVSNGVAITWVK